MDINKQRMRVLLIYRMERGENGYPDGLYDPCLIPIIESCLSESNKLLRVKEDDDFYTDEIEAGGKH